MLYSIAFLVMLVPIVHLLAVAYPIALADVREKRIPNKFTSPNILISLVCLIVAALLGQGWASLGAFVWAFAMFTGLFFIQRLGLLGMGDAKLLTAIALSLGWFSIVGVGIVFGLTLLFVIVVAVLQYSLKRFISIPLAPVVLCAFMVAVWLSLSGLV